MHSDFDVAMSVGVRKYVSDCAVQAVWMCVYVWCERYKEKKRKRDEARESE